MSKLLEEATFRRDLEPLLERRRRMEAEHHKGSTAHGNGDFLLWHDRLMAALLKASLHATGLYQRGLRNALQPVVRHLQLEFVDLPAQLQGFRILHLSDLHIDGMDGLAEIVSDLVSNLPVDLCVLTGDYRFEVYGACNAIYPRMRRILDGIRSRHGVVGILGNHDCADIAVELERMGVRMLINEALEVGSPDFWVIGVDDPHYYGCDDLAGALAEVPKNAFKLLLAHTPEMFDEAATAGIGLYLSGHTHAGQICLPWIGPLVLNAACPGSYKYGYWNHGGMQGYTTAGAGCSLLPVRFNCPPEIVTIELAKARPV